MQTNPAAEQSKIIRWSESPRNQSGRNAVGVQVLPLFTSCKSAQTWPC